MKAKLIVSLVITIILIVGGVLLIQRNVDRSSTADNCTYESFCGTDGVTYSSDCAARDAGATIERSGACSTETQLSPDERKYLSWLLRKRLEFQLPNMPIIHIATEAGTCEGCTQYTYAWGNGTKTATITVQEDIIIEATDTDGTNYTEGEEILPTTS